MRAWRCLVISGLLAVPDVGAAAQIPVVRVTPASGGTLTPERLAAIAPRVAAVSASPGVLRLHVGDTVAFMDSLHIVVLDSSGAVLGTTRFWDARLHPGAARFVRNNPRRLIGAADGRAELVVTFPRQWWGGRADAPVETRVRIEVLPTSPGASQPDLLCPRDADSAIAIVAADYAGFPAVHDAHRATADSAASELRRAARAATNRLACNGAIAEFLDAFGDRYLLLRDATEPSPQPPLPPSIRWKDDTDAVLTLPDFSAANAPVLDSLLGANAEHLARTAGLVFDLRHNARGSSATYAPLRTLFYTGPIHRDGSELRSPGSDAFTILDSAADIRFDSARTNPKRIAAVVDRDCIGACEEFVLELRQSDKLNTMVGENTGGAVDYSRQRAMPLSDDRMLLVPSARSRRLPARPLNGGGIPPAIRYPALPPALDIALAWVHERHANPFEERLADKTPRERTWIAGRYDASHIVVFFDTAHLYDSGVPRRPLTPDARADMFRGLVGLLPQEAGRVVAQRRAEHFALGDRYALMLDKGHVAAVTLTGLVGFEGDEGSGNASFVGAIATIPTADLAFFTKNYYVLRPHDDQQVVSSPATPAELIERPVDSAERAGLLDDLRSALRATADTSIPVDVREGPLHLQSVQVISLPEGERYFVRGITDTSGTNPRHCAAIAAWIAVGPPRRSVSVESHKCYFQWAIRAIRVLNVVALGDGRVGVLLDEETSASRGITLYQYQDGATLAQMHVLQSISNGD